MSKKGQILSNASSSDITERKQMEEPSRVSIPDEQYNMPVEYLNLSKRTLNCLKRRRIATIGELVRKEEKELLLLRNFGQKSKREVNECLAAMKLSLVPVTGKGRMGGVMMSKKENLLNNTSLPDTIKRKRAEEALRESEDKFRTMTAATQDAMIMIDNDGKVVYWNAASEKMFGYSSEDIIGKELHAMLAPQHYHEAFEKGFGKFKMTGQGGAIGKTLEVVALKKDGAEFPVELAVAAVKLEGKWNALGIIRDITERKRVEEMLRVSESKFRTIFNNVTDGMLVADVETKKFVMGNDAICDMLGYSHGEIENLGVMDIHPEEDLPNIIEEFEKQLKGKINISRDIPVKRKDSSIFYADINGTQITVGDKLYLVGNFRDITERKRVEQELREAQEKLIRSEKLAAIGQLAGGVGHELRNPLGAIKNAVYYIKGKIAKSELGQKEPEVIEFLDIMDDEINASNKIINDLLGLSRVGEPSVSPTRIEKIIEDTLVRIAIPENIKLTKKLDADSTEVEIDPGQIHQVFVNVITNAVQAMPEGGKLTVGARAKDGFLEVEIADTGCGIPEESVDKIFDPLFTTKARGIGLGLAVCKTIIDRHRGNIKVKSKVGKGTIFTVKLPLKRE